MTKKIFLCEYIHPEAYKLLRAHVEIIREWERLPEADGLINRNLQIDGEMMRRAEKLKVIGIHGTGTDGVDMDAAKEFGIKVFSVPHRNSQSVAEMNLALMLVLGRKMLMADQMVRQDRLNFSALQGTEFFGKTLGLIGVGEISRRTAKICKAGLGMRVIGWSRHMEADEMTGLGIERQKSMDEVFEKADVIMPGLDLTEETRRLIGRPQFEKMKPGAILINTSRGAILDEKALYEALCSGQISGAACDVFSEEPVTMENPLLHLANFIATPHLGANTEEALKNVGMAVVDGILERLDIRNKDKKVEEEK